MQCSSTSGQLQAIDLEHMKMADAKKINKVIGAVKGFFKGDANIMLMFSGGKLTKIKFLETTVPLNDIE